MSEATLIIFMLIGYFLPALWILAFIPFWIYQLNYRREHFSTVSVNIALSTILNFINILILLAITFSGYGHSSGGGDRALMYATALSFFLMCVSVVLTVSKGVLLLNFIKLLLWPVYLIGKPVIKWVCGVVRYVSIMLGWPTEDDLKCKKEELDSQ